jgi:YggT family protein
VSGILGGLAAVLGLFFQLYRYCIVIAVLLHLVNADAFNPIVSFFRQITEPVFLWVRRRLPFVLIGGLDLSPLVVYCIIIFLERALVGNLVRWAN